MPIILKGCYSLFSIYFKGANSIRRMLKLNFCLSSLSSVSNVIMYVRTPQYTAFYNWDISVCIALAVNHGVVQTKPHVTIYHNGQTCIDIMLHTHMVCTIRIWYRTSPQTIEDEVQLLKHVYGEFLAGEAEQGAGGVMASKIVQCVHSAEF